MTNNKMATPLDSDLPRWHRMYYLLAAFDVLTVALSLSLNYVVATTFQNSVNENASWVRVMDHVWETGRKSSLIAGLANDVFESRDSEANIAKIQSKWREFDEEIETMRGLLRSSQAGVEYECLFGDLNSLATAKAEMHKHTDKLLGRLAENQRDEAMKNLIAVNRSNARVLSIMKHFGDTIHAIEMENFRQEGEDAVWLQRAGGIVALMLAVMVAAATFWGFRLAQRATDEARQDRITKRELEQRVELRTLELQQAFRRHEDLIKQLFTVQEDERASIARDLHDEIGQSLASLMLGLRSLDDATDMEQVRANVGGLRRQAIQAAEEIRRLARGLRPAVLDDLGLQAAVERLASDANQTHGIQVDWNVRGLSSPRMPKVIETALYRIIQEALNNIVKHAHAAHAWIDLDRMPDKVHVQIADDGRGITPEVLTQAHQSGRMGVTGMRERATLLGGSVQFIRRGAGGTAVQVVLPLAGSAAGG